MAEHEAKLKALFDSFDSDNSGTVSFDEYSEGVKKLGLAKDAETLKASFDAQDKDKNGTLDFDEIKAMFANYLQKHPEWSPTF